VLVLGTENGRRDAGPVAPDDRGTGDHRVRGAQAEAGGAEGTGDNEVGTTASWVRAMTMAAHYPRT